MRYTYRFDDGRPPLVVPRVKEVEYRNDDVTLVCDNELRVNIPRAWVSESREEDETRVFVPTRPDFVGITLPLFAHEEIIVPIAKEGIPAEVTITENPVTGQVQETIVNQDGTNPETFNEQNG